MQIANDVVESNGGSRKRPLYVGVENFHVTAVNPSLKELNDMGIAATTEPVYTGTFSRDYGEGEKEYDFFNIRAFLDNKNPSLNIKTQVQFTIIRHHQISTTGKYAVINDYGTATWLEDSVISSGTLPANMTWFLTDGVKKAYRGEEALITFIRALRNLPNVNMKTDVKDRPKGMANFTQGDLDNMFKGKFNDIRNAILSSNGKVGFLLGVRYVDGVYRQTLYNLLPLKAWVASTGKTDYLVKQVSDAQDNGRFADAVFDLSDTKLKEFDQEAGAPEPSLVTSELDAENGNDLPF